MKRAQHSHLFCRLSNMPHNHTLTSLLQAHHEMGRMAFEGERNKETHPKSLFMGMNSLPKSLRPDKGKSTGRMHDYLLPKI